MWKLNEKRHVTFNLISVYDKWGLRQRYFIKKPTDLSYYEIIIVNGTDSHNLYSKIWIWEFFVNLRQKIIFALKSRKRKPTAMCKSSMKYNV